LPVGPALHLPSGDLGVLDNGRLFYHQQWVAAVGVSPRVFLEVRDRDDRSIPVRLLHELRGYLTACGCDLIPLDDRCPVAWRLGSSFNAVRDLWITNFLHESERLLFAVPLPLSAQPRIVVPLAGLAEDGTAFWRAVILVADAIFSDAESLARRFRPQVAHLAAIWERRWNEALARATTPKSSPLMNGAGSPAVTGPGQIWSRRISYRMAIRCRRRASCGCCDGALSKVNF
jgi:hypothetical protein